MSIARPSTLSSDKFILALLFMTAVLGEIRFDTWVIPYLQLVIHVIHHFDKVVGYISAFCSPALISLLPFCE
jgi:hypothetical protein